MEQFDYVCALHSSSQAPSSTIPHENIHNKHVHSHIQTQQDDATAACTAMDGQRLMGRPLRVSLARTARHSEGKEGGGGGGGSSSSSNRAPDPPPSTDVVTVARQASEGNTTVHVGNLIGTETEENMRNAFKEFGQIDNIRVPGKNFGFVAFTTHLAVNFHLHTRTHACKHTPRSHLRT